MTFSVSVVENKIRTIVLNKAIHESYNHEKCGESLKTLCDEVREELFDHHFERFRYVVQGDFFDFKISFFKKKFSVRFEYFRVLYSKRWPEIRAANKSLRKPRCR